MNPEILPALLRLSPSTCDTETLGGLCALRWSSGPGDGAPDGLTTEDLHDMARTLESLARAMRREADRRWEERNRTMMRIVIDKASYERGRSDGETGRNSKVPLGVDSFSYYSGYIEGKAVRNVIREIEKERGGR